MSAAAPDSDGAHEEQVARLAKLMSGIRVAMVTTTDADGRMMSRPMAVQEVEFDGDLWFFTKVGGRKAEQIAREPRVAVSLSSDRAWISVGGTAELVRDTEKAKQLWNAGIEAWFPNGPEDPEIVLVKVHADGAEYWDTPGAGVVSVLSFIKAHVTGKPYHIEDVKMDL